MFGVLVIGLSLVAVGWKKGWFGYVASALVLEIRLTPFADRDDSSSTPQHLYRLDDLLFKYRCRISLPTPTLYCTFLSNRKAVGPTAQLAVGPTSITSHAYSSAGYTQTNRSSPSSGGRLGLVGRLHTTLNIRCEGETPSSRFGPQLERDLEIDVESGGRGQRLTSQTSEPIR